jgi:type IV pilus assembly protein PilQ
MRRAVVSVILLLTFSLIGCATTGKVVEKPPTLITSVNVMDNAVRLKMDGSFTYTVYKPKDPFTVVVDLPGVGMGDIAEKIVSDKAGISEVNITKTETPVLFTKVEILLDSPSRVEPDYTGTSLILKVKKETEEEAARAEEGVVEEEAAEVEERDLGPATEVESIRFDYVDGTLRVIIKGDGLMSPDVFVIKNRIVVDVPDVSMEAALPESVISPITAIRYGMHKDKVRLVFDLEKKVEFSAAAEDDTIIIDIPAEDLIVVEEEAVMEEEEMMPEEKIISLDFQKADVEPIFRFLGDVAGYNVVIHQGVSGKVTLKLLNVPWTQALDIVLEISGFDKKIEGNILTIAPTEVFTKLKEDKAKLKEVETRLEVPRQEIIYLDYIEVTDMKDVVDEAKIEGCSRPVRTDERLKALIVTDTGECIRNLKEEVVYWDTPEHRVMQVLIEAKIVEVSSGYSQQLGIRWGTASTYTSGSLSGDFSVNSPVGTFGASEGSPATPKGGFNIGFADTLAVDLSLEALESVSKSRKLSNPKVLTLDDNAASITQGTQIFLPQTTAEGTGYQAVAASLTLDVTPVIKGQEEVELTVTASRNTPGAPVAGNVSIDTNSVNTKALVRDGETLVLGGIYTKDELEGGTRLPILGRIPILGWLFKTRTSSEDVRELLIFITPRIVKPGV